MDVLQPKKILDPCCGSKMFWHNRQNPDVIFGDKRVENHILCDGRTLLIEPDVMLDFTDLPFADGSFKMVVFDPPHLVSAGPKSWMAKKYGKLSEAWQDDIRIGFSECFRVLEDAGVLIFKWNETQIRMKEILALTEEKPLFGHLAGRKGVTHWQVFMKRKSTQPAAEKD